jgi:hypothetical protein
MEAITSIQQRGAHAASLWCCRHWLVMTRYFSTSVIHPGISQHNWRVCGVQYGRILLHIAGDYALFSMVRNGRLLLTLVKSAICVRTGHRIVTSNMCSNMRLYWTPHRNMCSNMHPYWTPCTLHLLEYQTVTCPICPIKMRARQLGPSCVPCFRRDTRGHYIRIGGLNRGNSIFATGFLDMLILIHCPLQLDYFASLCSLCSLSDVSFIQIFSVWTRLESWYCPTSYL